jgi:hypothetical protein
VTLYIRQQNSLAGQVALGWLLHATVANWLVHFPPTASHDPGAGAALTPLAAGAEAGVDAGCRALEVDGSRVEAPHATAHATRRALTRACAVILMVIG